MCQRIEEVLTSLGIPYSENRGRNASKFRIGDGRRGLCRFINAARPLKAPKLDPLILTTRYRNKDRVVSIEPDGHEAVYALQTESGNYVAWGYASSNCPIYDAMFQQGYSIHNMRVSNLHHETAVVHLRTLQELEGDTWNKLTTRLAGVNTAKHISSTFEAPKTLPPMFSSWREYRDHLIENLIADPKIRAKFTKVAHRLDAECPPELQEKAHQLAVKALIINDYHGVKLGTFKALYGGKNGKGRKPPPAVPAAPDLLSRDPVPAA